MIIFFFIFSILAFEIPQRFSPAEKFSEVTQYRDVKAKIDLSLSPSKLKYEDLTQKGVDEAAALFKVKAEYGEMFGFKKWRANKHELFDDPKTGRSWVIEGHYESLEGKKIHFLEIYWASKLKAQEYLFTSEVSAFTLEKYKELFNP